MKITAIKQQLKNTERVSVFVDGKYEFSLSLDELLKHQLKNDMELDAADVKRLKKISADGKLRIRSMEWLLNRPHSEREFRDYLYKKKVEPELVESLLKEFWSKRYLDNRKFGEWFVDLQKRRGKSDRAIRAELFRKGINREMTDELLADGLDNELIRLKELVAKKRGATRYKNDPLKFKQYLARQGFSFDSINEALKNN